MVVNEELRKIRECKSHIYHGIRVLLATGRLLGCELKSTDFSYIKDEDKVYIDDLMKYVFGDKHTTGYYFPIRQYGTYERLINEVLDNGFSDDVSQLIFKIEHTGHDLVFALIYNDLIDSTCSRFDIYIINTDGEKR